MSCLLLDATMVTTIEVEVEELCRKAVDTTPIINPQTGFDNKALFPKASPAMRPVNTNWSIISTLRIAYRN